MVDDSTVNSVCGRHVSFLPLFSVPSEMLIDEIFKGRGWQYQEEEKDISRKKHLGGEELNQQIEQQVKTIHISFSRE